MQIGEQMIINWLSKAKANKNDEFYTLYKDVEKMLDCYDLTGQKILLPCDTPESAFVKYCENKGYDYDNKWYPESDFRDLDFTKYDWIITNPPFSLAGEFTKKCIESGKKFIYIGSFTHVYNVNLTLDVVPTGDCVDRFLNPKGENVPVRTHWYTNCPNNKTEALKLEFKYNKKSIMFENDTPYRWYKHYNMMAEDLPIGTKFLVPFTFQFYRYDKSKYKVLGFNRKPNILIRSLDEEGNEIVTKKPYGFPKTIVEVIG